MAYIREPYFTLINTILILSILLSGFFFLNPSNQYKQEIRDTTVNELYNHNGHLNPYKIKNNSNISGWDLYFMRVTRTSPYYFFYNSETGLYEYTVFGRYFSHQVNQCKKFNGTWSFEQSRCLE